MGILGDIFKVFAGNSARKSAKRRARVEEELMRAADARAERATQQLLDLAGRQEGRAQQLFDRYTGTFVPMEDRYIKEATRAADPSFEAGLAGADVEKQVGIQRGIIARQLGRRGVSPNSGAVIDAEHRLGLGAAAARAGASTMARRSARERELRGLESVVNFGKGFPATAGSYFSGAQSGYGQGAGLNAARSAAASERGMTYRGLEGKATEAMGESIAGLLDTVGGLFAMGGK
jgi:hypothetical protein